MNIIVLIKNLYIYIKDFTNKIGRMFFYEEDTPGHQSPPQDKDNKTELEKESISKKTLTVLAFIISASSLFYGCSKTQDVKIVHNYWGKIPSYTERKQQSSIDLYVYKNFKDINGKDEIVIYKQK